MDAKRGLFAFFCISILFITVAATVWGMSKKPAAPGYVEGQVLVQFHDDVSQERIEEIIRMENGSTRSVLRRSGLHQVTLPEGITLARAIEILAQQKQLVHELDGVLDQRIAALTSGYPGSEGLFFPDSYQYEKGASDWDILQRAFAAMQRALDEEWQHRSENLPYQSPYDALIMASIVERETGLPEERSEIAGVFVRRLYQNMRLQTDPTIIYGLGDTYQGNLRRKHLEDESNRYNTYRHKGLPPTPIALPGRAAIHAALHPQDGKTLYFVARGDGGHYFSETLAEHQQAVRKYQLNRRQDYRSSPEKR